MKKEAGVAAAKDKRQQEEDLVHRWVGCQRQAKDKEDATGETM
jgi:hypothetical protein